jgi:hypothetical protein
MKKAISFMVSIVFLLGMVGLASAQNITSGGYTGALSAGTWYETYDGGYPGQPGNQLWAFSDLTVLNKDYVPTAEWSVGGLYLNRIVDTAPGSSGGTVYQTLYNGYNLLDPINSTGDNSSGYYYEPNAYPKIWTLSNLSATVFAELNSNGTYNQGSVTLTGNQTSSYDPPFYMTGDLLEMGYLYGTANGDPTHGGQGPIIGHWGTITNITVGEGPIQTPEPTTMLLLGLGLAGLAGIRRKL